MFSLFLFCLFFCLVCFIIYSRKNPGINSHNLKEHSDSFLDGSSYHLACLLEDAPSSSLNGQFYELATPLMTPLACIVPETWHQFYFQHLKLSGIHYWEWQDKPESTNVCQELSLLFDLPMPTYYARRILEVLPEGKNPLKSFYIKKLNKKCKFDSFDFQLQKQIYIAFKQWHDVAQNQIGVEALKSVYKVCYGASWELIEEILKEKYFLIISQYIIDESAPWWKVLGVHPQSNSLQVEQAYNGLVRTWHPDLNQHPLATDVTVRINMAYEQYQIFQQKQTPKPQINANTKLWLKIREWILANRYK